MYGEELSAEERFFGKSIVDKSINITGLYFLSQYPKVVGGTEIVLMLFSPNTYPGDEWIYLPSASYNLFFEPSDVGPEGRSRVFLANAGLMIAGHYAYEWFFKKEIEEPISLQFHPIITKDRYTLAIIKPF